MVKNKWPSKKPPTLTGCKKPFQEGELGVTFNHGGRNAVIEWTRWAPEVQMYGITWKCGVSYRDCLPLSRRSEGNATTYYCRDCLTRAGLLW